MSEIPQEVAQSVTRCQVSAAGAGGRRGGCCRPARRPPAPTWGSAGPGAPSPREGSGGWLRDGTGKRLVRCGLASAHGSSVPRLARVLPRVRALSPAGPGLCGRGSGLAERAAPTAVRLASLRLACRVGAQWVGKAWADLGWGCPWERRQAGHAARGGLATPSHLLSSAGPSPLPPGGPGASDAPRVGVRVGVPGGVGFAASPARAGPRWC